jgi:hypothetical protein
MSLMEITLEELRARRRKYCKTWLEKPGSKEKRREGWKRFREKHRDRRNAEQRETWRERTPEQIEYTKDYKKKWAAKNREILKLKRQEKYEANPEKYRLSTLRNRCNKRGIPFNLDEKDIIAPEFCPVLGIKLRTNYKIGATDGGITSNSPTVDRIIPELGYVKGNIIVVSHLANRIRNNATPQQIRMVAKFYESLLK